MILPMSRIRLVGAQDELPPVLRLLLDFGRVQLDDMSPVAGLQRLPRTPREEREARHLRRLLDDVEVAIEVFAPTAPTPDAPEATHADLARWAREGRRARREAERIRERRHGLEDERVLLQKHQGFLELFGPILAELSGASHLVVYGITLPESESAHVDRVADLLRTRLGTEVSLTARALPGGDLAVLITVPESVRGHMEKTLAGAGIPEIPLPPEYSGQTLGEAAPKMLERLRRIPEELREVECDRADAAQRLAPNLLLMRALTHDRLSELQATGLSAVTAHAFVLEGWLPTRDLRDLRRAVDSAFGDRVIVEEVAREHWKSREAPVVLTGPKIFAPFEAITKMMPLPRYGTIDPTPYLAVTFPMLYGLILGDAGYGLLLLAAGLVIRARTPGESKLHTASLIAIACAAFATIFGVLYGEFFGDLGKLWFGIHPILLDREEAVVAAAVVAVGIGLGHVLLGLVLGMVNSVRGEPRLAVSRAVQIVMLLLIVLALLAAVEVLPSRLFGPLGLAALIGFPVLLAIEGIVAPIEFFSTLGNVLSYIRIMALGTASVMLAVLANQMVGIFGSVVVGVTFALLFHLVNFALGLFSPTIHALRLHYVEFFRQFYSGGGKRYEPFAHWRPTRGGAASP